MHIHLPFAGERGQGQQGLAQVLARVWTQELAKSPQVPGALRAAVAAVTMARVVRARALVQAPVVTVLVREAPGLAWVLVAVWVAREPVQVRAQALQSSPWILPPCFLSR